MIMIIRHFHLEPLGLARASCSLMASNDSANYRVLMIESVMRKTTPEGSGVTTNNLEYPKFPGLQFKFEAAFPKSPMNQA
jgi:hypothetical protein